MSPGWLWTPGSEGGRLGASSSGSEGRKTAGWILGPEGRGGGAGKYRERGEVDLGPQEHFCIACAEFTRGLVQVHRYTCSLWQACCVPGTYSIPCGRRTPGTVSIIAMPGLKISWAPTGAIICPGHTAEAALQLASDSKPSALTSGLCHLPRHLRHLWRSKDCPQSLDKQVEAQSNQKISSNSYQPWG